MCYSTMQPSIVITIIPQDPPVKNSYRMLAQSLPRIGDKGLALFLLPNFFDLVLSPVVWNSLTAYHRLFSETSKHVATGSLNVIKYKCLYLLLQGLDGSGKPSLTFYFRVQFYVDSPLLFRWVYHVTIYNKYALNIFFWLVCAVLRCRVWGDISIQRLT
jgi:hypothetical protein